MHATGLPFNDPSGDRLRAWLGVSRDQFYDPLVIAIVPMGFCYPGTGRSGDLPPRPECAIAWRSRVLAELPAISLTLVLGQYAQNWHLKGQLKKTLTGTALLWRNFLPAGVLPLPHPSPRNIRWFKANPWFEADVVPALQKRVSALIS